METLTHNRKIKLSRINQERTNVGRSLNNGFITEEDIINIIQKDINYGTKTSYSSTNPKIKMLKNIFNCPFLLCDQENLSLEMKNLLPCFLSTRYNTEKNMLDYYLKECYIDEEEYKNEIDELKFVYYESSNDGKSILETGHVVLKQEKVKNLKK